MTTFGLYLDCYGKAYFERHMILTMSKNFRGYYKNFSPPCVSVWSILKNKCFSCYNLPNTVVVTVVVCLVAATKCHTYIHTYIHFLFVQQVESSAALRS